MTNKELYPQILLSGTCQEFIDFMNELFPVNIVTYYKAGDLFTHFINQYPDYDKPKFTRRRFTQMIKCYMEFSGKCDPFKKSRNAYRSPDGTRYFIFTNTK